MLFLLLTSAFFSQTTCFPNVENLMNHFFNDIPSFYYFCDIQEAAKVIGMNKGKYEKIKILNEKTDFEIKFDNSQAISVFLDLSCDRGYDFLEENLSLFNISYHWLMLSENVEKTLDFLRPSRLSVDSDVILATHEDNLYDLFRIHRTFKIENVEIGYLAEDEFSLIERPPRNNFDQFVFNASLMMADIEFNMSNLIPPLLDKSYEVGVDMVRRYGLNLFLQMGELYNFKMNYVTTKAWGEQMPNGSWTGMLGQIITGKAEFGLAPAKFSVVRTGVIDYIAGVHIVRVCFTFLQPKLFGTYKALILPLDPIVWACLGACSFFGLIAFKAVSKYDESATVNDNLGGSTLMVLSSIAQQAILNGLLLQAPNAIQNVDQLLQSDIKLGMLDSPYIIHETHTYNDTYSIKVRQKLSKIDPKYHFFDVKEGVKHIKKGQFAYYTEDAAAYAEISRTMSDAQICALSEVEKYHPFHVGVVAEDNSAYRDLFAKGFIMMRERGLVARLKDYWFIKKPECHWKQDAISLGLQPMALAYFVLILGYILALVALYCEIWKSRQTKKPKNMFEFNE